MHSYDHHSLHLVYPYVFSDHYIEYKKAVVCFMKFVNYGSLCDGSSYRRFWLPYVVKAERALDLRHHGVCGHDHWATETVLR